LQHNYTLYYFLILTPCLNITNFMKTFIKKEHSKILIGLHNPEFKLEDLVSVSGMSRSGYMKKFKVAFGMTPIEYCNDLRMQIASELLRTTDYQTKRIALEVGISDRHYFCKCFKQHFNMTATEYRNSLK